MALTVTVDNGANTDFDVDFGSGAANNATQRIILASDDAAVTSLGVMDDWDESDRAKVNLVVGQAGVPAGNGTAATSLRVTIASDSTGQVAVASLPASTNTIEVVGDVAEDVGLSGNPVRIGVRASNAAPSAMSGDGDAVTPWARRDGMAVMGYDLYTTSALIPTIDTAVYADLDRVGTVVTVSSAARYNGGSGIIVGGLLQDDAASNFSIEANFYAVTPTMANADNGVFDISDANVATAIPLGTIDFWSANTKSYTSNRQTMGTMCGGQVYIPFTCASGDTAIYMILRARGAYDAVATDDLTVWLKIIRF